MIKPEYTGKKFKIIVPIQKTRSTEGRLYLDGIASTTDVDYDYDEMTPEAIESMKEQAVDGITGFEGHDYSLKSIFGKVIAVKDTDNTIFAPIFRVRKSKEAEIKELIEDGIELGLSIGGVVKNSITKGERRIINAVKLFEISLTPIPANPATLGTIGITEKTITDDGNICLGSVACQIFKSIDKKYFKPKTQTENTEKATGYSVNTICYTWAMSQIKSGSYDSDSGWSFNDASDGGELLGDNNNWSKYGKMFLAIDKNKNPESKGAYHFPVGKMKNGTPTLFRSGVMAAKRAASGARSGVKQSSIADACDRLITAMDKKEKDYKIKEVDKMEKDEIEMLTEGITKGVVAGVTEANGKMIKDVIDALKPPEPTEPEPEPEPEPMPTKEEIYAELKQEIIKEFKGEPEPTKTELDSDKIIKSIAKDILNELAKARISKPRKEGPSEKFDEPGKLAKKTQTIREAAEFIAKNSQPLKLA